MFAVIAVVCFAIALILHLLSHTGGQYVTDFALGGLVAVAAHLAWGDWPAVWRRKG